MERKFIVKYDDTIIDVFTKLANKLLSVKYDWFINITISEIKSLAPHHFVGITGDIFVDSEWGKNQWKKYHFDVPMPDKKDELYFADFIGKDLGHEFSDELLTIFTYITGVHGKSLSYTWLNINLVNKQNNEINSDIRRIKKIMGS